MWYLKRGRSEDVSENVIVNSDPPIKRLSVALGAFLSCQERYYITKLWPFNHFGTNAVYVYILTRLTCKTFEQRYVNISTNHQSACVHCAYTDYRTRHYVFAVTFQITAFEIIFTICYKGW